ncbi:hypothetical protein PIB30_004079 [Stylosanthes scabra]|uniref:Uncharacterized protein n=1 Tax=Stylosanthes scabra TaxID=79078 RepID=A0ABU6Z496_9FABA|nr:hypothetical protein [Stylosanthes scabra]
MIYYRIPNSVVSQGVKYEYFAIEGDEDLRQFPKVRTMELFAKIVDLLASSGSSAPNSHSANVVGSSRPAFHHDTEEHQVASPTFKFNRQEEAVDCGGDLGDFDLSGS